VTVWVSISETTKVWNFVTGAGVTVVYPVTFDVTSFVAVDEGS
jgi:hypothetical protein